MGTSWTEGSRFSFFSIPTQHDVFVSFRGADTRKNFTSHLLAAFEQNGFCPFRDDKNLKRGEYISSQLLKAIEDSRISLIVFSKRYADSEWCLDELVKIMDCRKNLKQIVVPIYYDIDPSDLRKQTKVLEKTIAKCGEHFSEGPDGKVRQWRAALIDATNLPGWHLPNVANGDEAKFIKMIIEEVQLELLARKAGSYQFIWNQSMQNFVLESIGGLASRQWDRHLNFNQGALKFAQTIELSKVKLD